MEDIKIQLSPDIELVITAHPQGEQINPGAGITAYYKGQEVADAYIELWNGKLQLFAWDAYDQGGDPSFTYKTSMADLDLVLKSDTPGAILYPVSEEPEIDEDPNHHQEPDDGRQYLI